MKQSKSFIEKGKEHLVCRLRQSIYGLKQSPRCWNSVPCIYVKEECGVIFVIAVYVDYILLAEKSDPKVNEAKQALANLFQIKDL